MIAEDDVTSRTVLAGVLKKYGHDVVATENGTKAWQIIQQCDAPKLVNLDWIMPEMSGPEVVRQARNLQNDRPPYIIMLTAKCEKADIIAGLEAGANDYLSKPFDPGELRARVEVGRRMLEMQDALVESKETMAHQAAHDPLTGLLNRRAILDRLREELSRAGRSGDVLAVGICDVDSFKLINDTHGHQAGDDVLCGFSQVMMKALRVYDSIGRIGGEEFLLICPIKSGTDCMPLFRRLCKTVAESKLKTRSLELSITVSMGVVCASSQSTVDDILESADTALYRAKSEGRNRIAKGKHP